MITSIRPISYPGSALLPVVQTYTPEMLQFKAEIVAADCDTLSPGALDIRVRIWEGLARRYRILVKEKCGE